jgi:hypothetical protein
MITVTLAMPPARVSIVPDTRMISGSASSAHLGANLGAIAAGVALLLAVVVAAISQLAVLAAAMLAKAVVTLIRLLVFPLVVLLIVFLMSLAAHANDQAKPSSPTHTAPSRTTVTVPHPGKARRFVR